MTNPFDLTGKVALITGSGRGLGFGMAKGMAEAGATVVLNDISEEQLAVACAKLAEDGLKAETAIFDVTDSAAIAAAVADIEARVGAVDILVNNAGIQRRYPLVDFPDEEWQAVMDLNLTAPFKMAKAVAKGMLERQAGKIINICSLNAIIMRPTIPAYTAAKGGLMLLTRAMAVEWAKDNIQTNAIAPGYYDTEMTKPLVEDPEFDAFVKKRVPASRWGKPEDLAGTAVYLASNASNFVNGQMIVADGGMSCSM